MPDQRREGVVRCRATRDEGEAAVTKPYRPSNGDEGCWFQGRFCDECEHDRQWREKEKNPCEIMGNALAFDIGDPNYPPEWIADDDGSNPRCTAFEPEKPTEREPHPPYRCPKTLDLGL
jgi:hypothetical protein